MENPPERGFSMSTSVSPTDDRSAAALLSLCVENEHVERDPAHVLRTPSAGRQAPRSAVKLCMA
jgi:hypothetical protein